MTDDELESLKRLPVPAPRESAKAAALAAALETFDNLKTITGSAPQASTAPPRLTTVNPPVRRPFMRSFQPSMALAASFAALLVAVPAAIYVQRHPSAIFTKASESLHGGGDKRAPVPQPERDRIASIPKPAEPAKSDAPAPAPAPAVTAAATPAPSAANAPAAPAPMEKIERSIRSQEQPTSQFRYTGSAHVEPPAAKPAPTQALGEVRRRLSAAGEAKPQPGVADKRAAPPALAVGDGVSRADNVGALPERDAEQIARDNRDRFDATVTNPVKQVAADPVSTFSIDVDTASYSFVRRALNTGRLPQKDAVRIEEMINYFPYAYPKPETAGTPFQPTVTVMPSPWNAAKKLVHIGIKGYDLKSAERPRANLVFLIDVSGSMSPQDRLPLVKNAFRLLVDQLKSDDTVGIVTYASGTAVALEPTKVADKGRILAAIDRLGASGSTAGAAGIQDAYRLAEANFDKTAVNRIILATDGDFNVGITNQNELKGFIERKRDSGIFLSILGVGQDNHNDALMQALAQNGNGTAAYVDTLNEARKVLVEEASSTLFTIAKDVKIQLEFNPAQVSDYRLIGYETRALRREDFNNDKVDAGDIGSGHTVTAIYELTPVGALVTVDGLRYAPAKIATTAQPPQANDESRAEYGFLKLRYKLPNEAASKLVSLAVGPALETRSVDTAPTDVRFSVAVAAFGQLLRGDPFTQGYGYNDVIALAQSAKGDDPFGYRAEFINLVRIAKSARP
jgi:Ca-activated chloride channel homolog